MFAHLVSQSRRGRGGGGSNYSGSVVLLLPPKDKRERGEIIERDVPSASQIFRETFSAGSFINSDGHPCLTPYCYWGELGMKTFSIAKERSRLVQHHQ